MSTKRRTLTRPSKLRRDETRDNVPFKSMGSRRVRDSSGRLVKGEAVSPPRDSLGEKLSAAQVRKGLPVRALDELAGALKIDPLDLAGVLGTSVRTLQRRAGGNERLGPAASDRLARIRRILDLATHVLGESEKAAVWLTTASRPLDGEIPLQMLDTDIGTQRVQQELRQIEFGMPV